MLRVALSLFRLEIKPSPRVHDRNYKSVKAFQTGYATNLLQSDEQTHFLQVCTDMAEICFSWNNNDMLCSMFEV
jgi:hypothetical protein